MASCYRAVKPSPSSVFSRCVCVCVCCVYLYRCTLPELPTADVCVCVCVCVCGCVCVCMGRCPCIYATFVFNDSLLVVQIVLIYMYIYIYIYIYAGPTLQEQRASDIKDPPPPGPHSQKYSLYSLLSSSSNRCTGALAFESSWAFYIVNALGH